MPSKTLSGLLIVAVLSAAPAYALFDNKVEKAQKLIQVERIPRRAATPR